MDEEKLVSAEPVSLLPRGKWLTLDAYRAMATIRPWRDQNQIKNPPEKVSGE